MNMRFVLLAAAAVVAALVFTPGARAQTEYPPPSGKGPVVVVVSGQMGADHYVGPAKQIAALGYDAILIDGNDMAGSHGEAFRAVVQKAQSAAHGMPGKIGVVGFSLGGGVALGYASRWPDLVATVVVWYPATSAFRDISAFAHAIKVPVLMFAGEYDRYKDCCLIETARSLASAASAAGAPFELVAYPKTDHDFIFTGKQYNADATADSWKRAAAKLAQYLPR